MLFKYIGDSRTYEDLITHETVDLVTDQLYDIEIQNDGPNVRINDTQIIDPNSTFWIILNEGRISIPYSPQAISNSWTEG